MKNKNLVSLLGLSVLGVAALVSCGNNDKPHKTTPDVYFKAISLLPSYNKDGQFTTEYRKSQYTDEYCGKIEILNKDKLAYGQKLEATVTLNKYFSLHKITLSTNGSGDFNFSSNFVQPYVGYATPNNLYSYPLTAGEGYEFKELTDESNRGINEKYLLTIEPEYFKKNIVVAFGTAPGKETVNPMYQMNSAYYEKNTFICDMDGNKITNGLYNLKNSTFAGSSTNPVTIVANLNEDLQKTGYWMIPDLAEITKTEEGSSFTNLKVYGIPFVGDPELLSNPDSKDTFNVVGRNIFTIDWNVLFDKEKQDVRYKEIKVCLPNIVADDAIVTVEPISMQDNYGYEEGSLKFYAAYEQKNDKGIKTVYTPNSNDIAITKTNANDEKEYFIKNSWIESATKDSTSGIIGTFAVDSKNATAGGYEFKDFNPRDLKITASNMNEITFSKYNGGVWDTTKTREEYIKETGTESELKYSISDDENWTLIELNPKDRKYNDNLPQELQYDEEKGQTTKYFALVAKSNFFSSYPNANNFSISINDNTPKPVACRVTIDFSALNGIAGYGLWDDASQTYIISDKFDFTYGIGYENYIPICAVKGKDVDISKWQNLPEGTEIVNQYPEYGSEDDTYICAYIHFFVPEQFNLNIVATNDVYDTSDVACFMFDCDSERYCWAHVANTSVHLENKVLKIFGGFESERIIKTYVVSPYEGVTTPLGIRNADALVGYGISSFLDDDTGDLYITINTENSQMPTEDNSRVTNITVTP